MMMNKKNSSYQFIWNLNIIGMNKLDNDVNLHKPKEILNLFEENFVTKLSLQGNTNLQMKYYISRYSLIEIVLEMKEKIIYLVINSCNN